MSIVITKKTPFLDFKKIEDHAKRTPVPWGPIGYITYKRTYARPIPEQDRTEEWHETLYRCLNSLQRMGTNYSEKELYRFYELLYHMKGMLSGRALWQLGTKFVNDGYADSLINCWGIVIDHWEAFGFIFEELMLGGGVGARILQSDIDKLPNVRHCFINRVDDLSANIIVDDSREGWVDLLNMVMRSFFVTGESFTYSLQYIRPPGELIRGFGGISGGPDCLEDLIKTVCTILMRVHGTPSVTDVSDLINCLATCVSVANIRRSAEILVGDPSAQFLGLKRWDCLNVPNWRAMSNNTVLTSVAPDPDHYFWDGYHGNGEPYGLFNLELSKKYGRLNDYEDEHHVDIVNPCAEIPLASYECCNLSEIVAPNITSQNEALEIGCYLFKTNKTITQQKYLYRRSQDIIYENRKIGVSITGTLQPHCVAYNDFYTHLRQYDNYISEKLGINKSVRITTIQPSGTKSNLPGVTPGAHPAYSEYYIRRVRMASSEKLVDVCKSHGYKVEPQIKFDGTEDKSTVVVEFPVKAPDGAILSKNMSALDQLENLRTLQKIWADNAVSVTIYYKKEELSDIQKWLADNYTSSIKSVSFLLHQDHGFIQAPFEEISKEKYEELISCTKEIDYVSVNTYTTEISADCEGGSCPVR